METEEHIALCRDMAARLRQMAEGSPGAIAERLLTLAQDLEEIARTLERRGDA
jgi:hypothetical protein